MNELRDLIRPHVKDAMQTGGNMALDSAVRLIGQLVEKYTLAGKPHEAMAQAERWRWLRSFANTTRNSST